MLRRLFGDDVAEHDAHLADYFIETPTYRMALSGEKRFVIGRKGAGKSAICQQLQRELPRTGALCLPVEPQRIHFTALKFGLRDLARWGSESDTLMQRIWYYGLLSETALALTKLPKKGRDSDYAKIVEFIEKYYVHSEPHPFARILKTVFEFAQQLELGLGPVQVRKRQSLIDPIEVETQLEQLRIPLASFVARNLPQGIYILIDNLDEGWDNSYEANTFVRGLLLAVNEICQPNIPVRLIVFIRSDMYDCVTREFQHIDKYRQYQEYIAWDRRNLTNMVAERIRARKHIAPNVAADEVWSKVFAADDTEHDLPNYVIERSLMRPREVLQFCRLAAEKADSRHHDMIMLEDLRDAEKEYSRWKIEDLGNEFLFSYPGLSETVFKRFYGAPAHLEVRQLKDMLEEAMTNPKIDRKYDWISHLRDADELVQILYDIGFLKARSQAQEWQSAQYPDFNLDLAEDFAIHPVFRRHLCLNWNG